MPIGTGIVSKNFIQKISQYYQFITHGTFFQGLSVTNTAESLGGENVISLFVILDLYKLLLLLYL